MQKWVFCLFIMVLAGNLQAQHLFEHDYPVVQQENPMIRQLMDQVSKDSLEATINHLQSYPTRSWNSQMVYQVENWLYEKYRGMGIDTVFLHDFVFIQHDTLWGTSDNVIALQRGQVYPDEYVVCGAHYDSFNKTPGHPDSLYAPGADDNASGSAGIIETARLLSRCTFERSIIYCAWAAEEVNLRGSAAFAKECNENGVDIVGYFNLDMIGYLEEGLPMEVNLIYVNRDSTLANYIFNFSDVYYPDMPIKQSWMAHGDSDFSSFNRNQYAAVHIFERTRNYSPFIHTTSDVLGVSVNNMDQAKRYTELNLGLVATLAGLISNGVDDVTDNGMLVYPNPASGVITVKGLPMREVEVYNLMGQQVVSQAITGEECEIDVSALVPGIYFLRVLSEDGRNFTKKFMVQ